MRKIQTDFTASELAAILGISRQAVEKAAHKQNWPSRPRQGRGGGNAYPLPTLPYHVRQVVFADELGTMPICIHNADLPFEQLEALFLEFHAMPQKSKEVAEARFHILGACREFVAKNKLTVIPGRRAFADLYNRRAVPGLAPEVYQLVKTTSEHTIEVWQTAFNKYGLAGLSNKNFKSGRDTRITPEMELVFRAAIARTPGIRSAKLVEEMKVNFPPDQWVHKATVCRWHQRWKAEHLAEHLLGVNPSDFKNKLMPAYGNQANAPHAGHTWEMDSTPADIMTSDGKRCSIVAAIDVYSRRVVAVVANTSNSGTVAMCIRKGLMTFGKPEVIKKDNGADYSSKHILAITSGLKIDTPKLPPYSPEHKGIIERFFGTLSRDLEEMLPGYTGHSVAERAALRAQETWAKKVFTRPKGWKPGDRKEAVDVPLTQGEFMHLIECWIDVYEGRVHSGFAKEPGRKHKGLTPRQAFEQSKHKPKIFRDERMLDILLANVDNRKVTKKGISFGGAFYHAPALVHHSGQTVDIRLNPDDAGALYVFDQNKKFICIAKNAPLEGRQLAEYMEERNRWKKEIKETVRAAHILSRNTTQPYTVNLESGKLSKALISKNIPWNAPDAPLPFVPDYQSEEGDEARKAYEAYDGTSKPQVAAPGEPLRFEPAARKIIQPNTPAEAVDPLYPTGQDARNPIMIFEYYLKLADRKGIEAKDLDYMQYLWDTYSQVRTFHPRPGDELNIITKETAEKKEAVL